jgi:multiple sugar transport system permease protein
MTAQPTSVRVPSQHTRSRFRRPSLGLALRALALLAIGCFFGLPLIWLLIAPSKLDGDLLRLPPLAWGDIENYGAAFEHLVLSGNSRIPTWTLNSIFYTGTSMALAIGIAIPGGYALATARFPGRRLILSLTLVALIVPPSALVLPLFLEMNAVKLVNTAWSVILPSALFPFGVYLSYVFYATSLPKDLLSAGRVDGASEWQLFRHVALPLSGTLIGLLGFISFTSNWNSYFLPFVMLSKTDTYNLAVGLQALASGTGIVDPTLAGASILKRPEGALMGLLMVVPIAIVFIAAQRFVIRGALTGAVKE